MSHTRIIRSLVATTLLVACAGGSSAGNAAAKSSAATTSSADGVLAASPAAPHDTMSDRADAGRIAGDPRATLWVIMASDFQCPYCKSWHDAQFQTIMKNYVNTGRVRLAFLNMPLSIHPNAVPAAEAAMCASVQSKFWPMHEALFATQAKWEVMKDPTPAFDSLATSLGVKMPAWRECMTQHMTRPLIQADHDRATERGVGSTPSFFVGSTPLSGADADVKSAIDAALANARKKPAT